jgi:ketosteroid isomerase-like protein
MSEENVDIVRRAIETWGPDLSVVKSYFHPELDYRAVEGYPDDVGVMYGWAAVERYWGQWFETLDEMRAEPEEVVDAGEKVVARVHLVGRMKESDAEIDMRFGLVYTVREGLIVRGREYATFEEAKEKAGAAD